MHLFISHPYSVANPIGYTLKFCNFLSSSTVATLAQAIITSPVDYSSSLSMGPFAFILTFLQCVFNIVARIIILKHEKDHSTPVFKTIQYLLTSIRVERAYNHNNTL